MITQLARLRRLSALDLRDLTAFLSRFVSLGAGPVVAMAVGTFFSPQVQGYYFSFASLLGAQTLFESGVGLVVIQMAAHEVVFLKVGLDGSIEGDEQAKRRLASIFHFGLRWFSVLAGIMVFGVGVAGWLTLQGHSNTITWQIPWLLLVLASGLDFLLQPFLNLLEGCGKIIQVYRYRTFSVMTKSAVLIASAYGGLNLYSSALSLFAATLVGILYLSGNTRLFLTLLGTPRDSQIRWRQDILPFQWRIAISWMAGFFTTALFTPIVLAQEGAVAAGQMGMTVALLNGVTMVAFSLMQARIPEMGGLVAAGAWDALERLFSRQALFSIGLFVLGMATLNGAAWVSHALGMQIAHRILDPVPLLVLEGGFLASFLVGLEATYLRCQKREPFFGLSVVTGSLILLSSLLLGHRFGPTGIAGGYLAVYLLVALPAGTVITLRDRRRTRASRPNTNAGPDNALGLT